MFFHIPEVVRTNILSSIDISELLTKEKRKNYMIGLIIEFWRLFERECFFGTTGRSLSVTTKCDR